MLLHLKEKRRKRFIVLEKEHNELLLKERSLPWTEVKPYQDGWFIHIEFRDEIKRRSDYSALKAVLDMVARAGRTRDPKMVARLRSTKRLDAGYKLLDPKGFASTITNDYGYRDYLVHHSNWYYGNASPSLCRIGEDTFKYLPEAEQKWFTRYEDGKTSWFHAFNRIYYRTNIPHAFLRMKVRPAYVTHVRDIDPELTRRLSEVKKEMDQLRYYYHASNWNSNYDSYDHHFENRRRRAHDRASLRAIVKGEKEDFEHLRKNINYD